MTQRMRIPLWCAYGAATLLTLFLGMIFAGLGLPNDVLPALAAMVAVLEGGFTGGVFGLGLGLLGWLGGVGLEDILCCAVIAVACTRWEERRLRRFAGPCLGSALAGLVFTGLVRVVLRLAFGSGGSFVTLLSIAGKEAACSFVAVLLVCPLFLFIHRALSHM